MEIRKAIEKRNIIDFIRFLVMVIVLLLTTIPTTQAQRYIAGFSAVEGRVGIVEIDGLCANFGISKYTKGKNRWMCGVDYLQRNYAYSGMKIPLRQFTLTGGGNILLFSDPAKTFFVSIGAGLALGYELIFDGRKNLPDGAMILSENKFLYGAMLNVECEYYFDNDKIALFGVRQRGLLGSTVTPFHSEFFIGFKHILNNK